MKKILKVKQIVAIFLLNIFLILLCGCVQTENSSISSDTDAQGDSSITSDVNTQDSSSITSDTDAQGDCVITFVQEGEEDILFTVKVGEAFTQIPTPIEKAGYDVTWSVTDFSSITGNMTVRAVATPKTYKIFYDLGDLQGNAEIQATEQSVQFQQEYTLFTPTDRSETYRFLGWKIKDTDTSFTDGVYTRIADVTLVAQWKRVWSGDFS